MKSTILDQKAGARLRRMFPKLYDEMIGAINEPQ